MIGFSWEIRSIDDGTKTMLVNYKPEQGEELMLNLSVPEKGTDINEYIAKYAPQNTWAIKEYESVQVGQRGSVSAQEISVSPRVAGNFNEQFLRAMIYQVLEEIKDSEA